VLYRVVLYCLLCTTYCPLFTTRHLLLSAAYCTLYIMLLLVLLLPLLLPLPPPLMLLVLWA
jgi:hypothetical protein